MKTPLAKFVVGSKRLVCSRVVDIDKNVFSSTGITIYLVGNLILLYLMGQSGSEFDTII